jgi:hypothetical protein
VATAVLDYTDSSDYPAQVPGRIVLQRRGRQAESQARAELREPRLGQSFWCGSGHRSRSSSKGPGHPGQVTADPGPSQAEPASHSLRIDPGDEADFPHDQCRFFPAVINARVQDDLSRRSEPPTWPSRMRDEGRSTRDPIPHPLAARVSKPVELFGIGLLDIKPPSHRSNKENPGLIYHRREGRSCMTTLSKIQQRFAVYSKDEFLSGEPVSDDECASDKPRPPAPGSHQAPELGSHCPCVGCPVEGAAMHFVGRVSGPAVAAIKVRQRARAPLRPSWSPPRRSTGRVRGESRSRSTAGTV